MSKVAIVFHSGYGHTAEVAKAVARGTKAVAGSDVQLIPVAEVDKHWDDLAAADAIIFGAPTYMGSVSAPFKAFMDASSKVWMTQGWKDKIAAGFTHSGSQGGGWEYPVFLAVAAVVQFLLGDGAYALSGRQQPLPARQLA